MPLEQFTVLIVTNIHNLTKIFKHKMAPASIECLSIFMNNLDLSKDLSSINLKLTVNYGNNDESFSQDPDSEYEDLGSSDSEDSEGSDTISEYQDIQNLKRKRSGSDSDSDCGILKRQKYN